MTSPTSGSSPPPVNTLYPVTSGPSGHPFASTSNSRPGPSTLTSMAPPSDPPKSFLTRLYDLFFSNGSADEALSVYPKELSVSEAYRKLPSLKKPISISEKPQTKSFLTKLYDGFIYVIFYIRDYFFPRVNQKTQTDDGTISSHSSDNNPDGVLVRNPNDDESDVGTLRSEVNPTTSGPTLISPEHRGFIHWTLKKLGTKSVVELGLIQVRLKKTGKVLDTNVLPYHFLIEIFSHATSKQHLITVFNNRANWLGGALIWSRFATDLSKNCNKPNWELQSKTGYFIEELQKIDPSLDAASIANFTTNKNWEGLLTYLITQSIAGDQLR